MKLTSQVEALASPFVRKGNKGHRIRQRAQMLAFAAHAEGLGATEIGQVGATHVVKYWKACRGKKALSFATQMDHWRAIRELWILANKPGEPPRPRIPDQPAAGEDLESKVKPFGSNSTTKL